MEKGSVGLIIGFNVFWLLYNGYRIRKANERVIKLYGAVEALNRLVDGNAQEIFDQEFQYIVEDYEEYDQ